MGAGRYALRWESWCEVLFKYHIHSNKKTNSNGLKNQLSFLSAQTSLLSPRDEGLFSLRSSGLVELASHITVNGAQGAVWSGVLVVL